MSATTFLDTVARELHAIRDELNECTRILEQREKERELLRLHEQMRCMDESPAERRERLWYGPCKPYSND